jgi:flagellar hook-associated protein FlgK
MKNNLRTKVHKSAHNLKNQFPSYSQALKQSWKLAKNEIEYPVSKNNQMIFAKPDNLFTALQTN